MEKEGTALEKVCPEDTVQQEWRFLTMLKLVAKLLFPPTTLKSAGAISKSLMCSGFFMLKDGIRATFSESVSLMF